MASLIPLEGAFYRLRRVFWWSLGFALAFHLALVLALVTVFSPKGTNVPEPARVKFFTRRDPTLSKPLEVRKVPQPKRQLVRREVQVSAARMDQVRATAAFDTRSLIAGQGSGASTLALPRQLDLVARPAMGLEPGLEAQRVNASRTVENKIDPPLPQ